MQHTRSVYFSLMLLIGDFVALILAFIVAYYVRVKLGFPDPLSSPVSSWEYIGFVATLLPLWLASFVLLGLYSPRVYERRGYELTRLLAGSLIGMLILIGYDFLSDEVIFPARLLPFYGALSGFGLLLLVRGLMRGLRRLSFKYGVNITNVLVIGASPVTRQLLQAVADTKHSGYQLVGFVGPASLVPKGLKPARFGTAEEAIKRLDKLGVQAIFQTELYDNPERNRLVMEAALVRHISYGFIPAASELYAANNRVELFRGYPVVSVHQTPLVGWGRVLKRLFDLTVSGLALVVLSPLMLVIAVLIKIFDSGPVIFKQKRITRFNNEFTAYKFRTMSAQYSGRDPLKVLEELGRKDLIAEFQKYKQLKHDPRVSGPGKFLRRSSLDELPQLFNVFRGDISLVGPRARLLEELKFYKGKESLLLSVKTGLTGLAQVSGRSEISFEERVKLDLFYVQNWSFWLDIKILFRTAVDVLSGKNSR